MMQASCLSRSDASLAQLRNSTKLNHKQTTHRASSARSLQVNAFFGKKKSAEESEKEAFRKEQFEAQQEILNRRRKGTWQAEVKERRGKVSKYMRDPEYKKQIDAENREKFLKRKEEEGPEPKFGIIIPIIPLGLPEYDGGERFDLRLPHVDNGWVDEEADFGKQVARFFGFGKKKE